MIAGDGVGGGEERRGERLLGTLKDRIDEQLALRLDELSER